MTGLITKIVVTVLGLAVVAAGLVMMVTPGPGIVGILVGLGILSTEWHWAERWMHSMKDRAQAAADKARDMDPAVRRRRLLLSAAGVLVLVGGVVGYVGAYGWPDFAVSGWDWVQRLHEAIPELPGM
ncbi:MAG: PGPGW domain-containing protein [Nocardioides sp.]